MHQVQLQSSQVFDLVLVRLHCCEYIAARVLDGTHEEDQALFAGLVAIHSARGSVGAGSAVLAVGDAAPSVLQPVSDAPPNKDHPFIHSMCRRMLLSAFPQQRWAGMLSPDPWNSETSPPELPRVKKDDPQFNADQGYERVFHTPRHASSTRSVRALPSFQHVLLHTYQTQQRRTILSKQQYAALIDAVKHRDGTQRQAG